MSEAIPVQKPKCPNHKVNLDLSNNDKGVGICPISGAVFSYSYDDFEKTKKLRINSFGKPEYVGDYKLTHIEGEDI